MKKKVLYLEDNEQNYYMVTFMLNAAGIDVQRVSDEAELVDNAKAEKYDMILLDIKCRQSLEYCVIKELREVFEYDDLPIVAIISSREPCGIKHVLNAGCNGIIEKPINPDTFITEVLGYLSLQYSEIKAIDVRI